MFQALFCRVYIPDRSKSGVYSLWAEEDSWR